MGVGEAKQDSRDARGRPEQLATIAGQQPNVRRARKSIAALQAARGHARRRHRDAARASARTSSSTACSSIAIPRIRDFRGLNPRSFDGRGNYSMGVREQIIFPEIDYDAIDQVRGLDITITTTAKTDEEAFALLEALRHAVRPRRAGGGLRDASTERTPSRRGRDRGHPWPRPHSVSASSGPAKYKTREYTRCRRCGRPRAVYRKFGLCRICLREIAHKATSPA